MDIEEIMQDIRKRCRMQMNGITSASMRRQGLNYKLNFGVSIGQIKELSKHYDADADLASTLWKDGTRELKILGTLLYPKESFSIDQARRWIEQIPNQEIREQLTANLLQDLPYIDKLSKELASDIDVSIRTTVYWMMARYLSVNKQIVEVDLSSYPLVWHDIAAVEVSLRNASSAFLRYACRITKETADRILEEVAIYRNSENVFEKEAYNSLRFEFEFLYG